MVLTCVTPKNDDDLTNYNKPYVEKNNFAIRDEKLYVRYDDDKIIQVPGYYSNSEFKESNYLVSKEKTVFSYRNDEHQYFVYSNDMGETWNTVPINDKYGIVSICFVNSDVGYILELEDYAMGSYAGGKLLKTSDGGNTWKEIFYGIGEGEKKKFCKGSQIRFDDEMTGYLTMPSITGESSELYKTEDGGVTFFLIQMGVNEN